MSIPEAPVPIPEAVARRYGSRLTCLWKNLLGGLTFSTGTLVIKWSPWNPEIKLAQEVERSRWASRWIPVPKVVDYGHDEHGEWMVSEVIAGDTAIAPQWLKRPEIAVPELGRALRRLHEVLPTQDCPWRWDADSRLADLKERGIAPEKIAAELETPPEASRLVVCHGDACSPNTLLDAAGNAVAYVDLGALGVGDFWSDLAVAAESAVRNFGPGWDTELIQAYGVPLDKEKLEYYQKLWNVG